MGLSSIGKVCYELELSDGKVYRLSPITIGILADLTKRNTDLRKKEYLDAVRSIYGDNPPAEAVAEIAKELNQIRKQEDDLDIFGGGYEGFKVLFWYCLKEYNPNMTEDEAGKLLTIAVLNKFKDVILAQVQGFGQPDEEKKTNLTENP